MSYVSEEVRAQVAALETREKALATRAKRLSPVWMGLAGATGGTSLLARFLGPDKQPSSIDVPAKVLELFSANVPSSGGSMPFESAAGAMTNMLSSMQPVIIGVAVTGMVVAGGVAVFKGEMGGAIKAMVGGVMVIGALSMTNFIFGATGGPDGAQVSPRASFMEAVEKHRYGAVLEDLKAVKLDATTAGAYVLAQVAIADGDEATKPARKTELEKAVASPPVGPAFTPTGQALYAIEHAAFGAPKSPAAVAYRDERLARQGWANVATTVLGALAMAAGGVALGFLVLRRTLAQRVRRIQDLLTPGAATANNN